MEVDELFEHALGNLSEAAGELLRAGHDPREYVFASFDGASPLGMVLILGDVASDLGGDVRVRAVEGHSVRVTAAEVAEMIRAARGEGSP